MSGPNLSFLREKFGVVSSFLTVGGCPSLFCFVMGFFLSCSMYRSYSSSVWVSSRGYCSVCRCRFSVSFGGGEFRILLCHHLQLEPSYLTSLVGKSVVSRVQLPGLLPCLPTSWLGNSGLCQMRVKGHTLFIRLLEDKHIHTQCLEKVGIRASEHNLSVSSLRSVMFVSFLYFQPLEYQ